MNYIGVVVFAIEGCSSLVKSSKLKAKDACESLVNWSSCDSARLPSSSHLTMSIKPKKLTPAALRVCDPKRVRNQKSGQLNSSIDFRTGQSMKLHQSPQAPTIPCYPGGQDQYISSHEFKGTFRGCLVAHRRRPRHTCGSHGELGRCLVPRVRHATDCGCHQFCGWCLVSVKGVAATTAPSTKTRHSCGAGIRRLTFGAVVVASHG